MIGAVAELVHDGRPWIGVASKLVERLDLSCHYAEAGVHFVSDNAFRLFHLKTGMFF